MNRLLAVVAITAASLNATATHCDALPAVFLVPMPAPHVCLPFLPLVGTPLEVAPSTSGEVPVSTGETDRYGGSIREVLEWLAQGCPCDYGLWLYYGHSCPPLPPMVSAEEPVVVPEGERYARP